MAVSFRPHVVIADTFDVLKDGEVVGSLRKAQHGPGFFLKLFDSDGKPVTWKNAAPGARIQQEKDFAAKETYCKSQAVAKKRVEENPQR